MNDILYWRQLGDVTDPGRQKAWAQECVSEMRAMGVGWMRFSEHPDFKGLFLAEGWAVRPSVDPEPSFALVASEGDAQDP